jgi:hypothetical protein
MVNRIKATFHPVIVNQFQTHKFPEVRVLVNVLFPKSHDDFWLFLVFV